MTNVLADNTKCGVCSRKFESATALKQHHQAKHADPKADGGQCPECNKYFRTDQGLDDHLRAKHNAFLLKPEDMEPDWDGLCENCDQSPIVPITGLCGPCTWGEAETIGGNW